MMFIFPSHSFIMKCRNVPCSIDYISYTHCKMPWFLSSYHDSDFFIFCDQYNFLFLYKHYTYTVSSICFLGFFLRKRTIRTTIEISKSTTAQHIMPIVIPGVLVRETKKEIFTLVYTIILNIYIFIVQISNPFLISYG